MPCFITGKNIPIIYNEKLVLNEKNDLFAAITQKILRRNLVSTFLPSLLMGLFDF